MGQQRRKKLDSAIVTHISHQYKSLILMDVFIQVTKLVEG